MRLALYGLPKMTGGRADFLEEPGQAVVRPGHRSGH